MPTMPTNHRERERAREKETARESARASEGEREGGREGEGYHLNPRTHASSRDRERKINIKT